MEAEAEGYIHPNKSLNNALITNFYTLVNIIDSPTLNETWNGINNNEKLTKK
jgi:hypothetical protein